MLLEDFKYKNLSRLNPETFNCRCFKITPNLSETYTGSVVRLVGELSHLQACVRSFLPMVKMVPLVDKFRSIFTNGTNIRQQMTQTVTEYSVGNSTNAGKVT